MVKCTGQSLDIHLGLAKSLQLLLSAWLWSTAHSEKILFQGPYSKAAQAALKPPFFPAVIQTLVLLFCV